MGIRNGFGRLRYIAAPLITKIWVPLLYQVLAALGIIIALWDYGDRALDEQEKLPEGPEIFDFIIVGAGSAGSVAAYRLSQHYSVLLLEAGGEPNPLQYVPGFAVFLTNRKGIDWMHRSIPQKYGSLSSVNQQSSWSAGLGLGGTGNLNYMIHLRGHTQDYDNWSKLTGDPSWGWEGCLPYFKSYEDYDEGGDERYHGFGGPLRVGEPSYVGLSPEWVRAGQELGYPQTDLNAPFTEGFDSLKYTISYGMRNAPYLAFLRPARRRSTLTVRKFSYVTRVLFKEGNEAYGVEYQKNGKVLYAYAKKEVILSAGTITTPRVLMHSGIGPAEHLRKMGIPVRVNLPVGEFVQDHLAVYLGPFFIDKPRTMSLERDLTPGAFVQWFTGGRGVLSSPGANSVGIVSSEFAKARFEGNWPDLILYYFGVSVFRTFAHEFSRAFNLKYDEQLEYFKDAFGKESFLVAVSGARPLSKGTIKLGGPSPFDDLEINPNYLSDPDGVDLKVLVDGIKKTLRIVENSTAIGKEMNGRFTTSKYPGCEHLEFRSDDYWTCYAKRYSVTLHHPVGSCGMGRVVNTKLQVLGTSRLRILDNSVQPEIIISNTQAPALMIGEKGSDIILKYWSQDKHQTLQKTKNSWHNIFLKKSPLYS